MFRDSPSTWLGSGLGDDLSEPGQAGEHSALDRPEWNAEPFGQLRLRVAPVVRKLECLALVGRELGERRLDRCPLVAQIRFLVDGRAAGLGRLLERVAATPVLSADEIDRPAMD